jgi:hypothetical protein
VWYGPRYEPEFDFVDFFEGVFVYPLEDINFLVLDADVVPDHQFSVLQARGRRSEPAQPVFPRLR